MLPNDNYVVADDFYHTRSVPEDRLRKSRPETLMASKITGQGETAEWLGQKARVKGYFNTFAATDDSGFGGTLFDAVAEATLCSKDTWERFAYYLMHVHSYGTDGKGNPLRIDGSTASNYLGIAINLAADKYKANGGADAKQFFNCLDKTSSSPEALWLRRLKTNIERQHIKRAQSAGKPLDKSASKSSLFLECHPSCAQCVTAFCLLGSRCSADLFVDAQGMHDGARSLGLGRGVDAQAGPLDFVGLGRPVERDRDDHLGWHGVGPRV
jgi:hypothetical protein